jgi:predicted DNA-binding antitoxin AbrB/MazE fold protein
VATIRAIYENGVFHPLDPVDIPDGSRVKLANLRVIGVESGDDYESIKRELQIAFDQADRGEVSDLDMQELLSEAHRRHAERRKNQT